MLCQRLAKVRATSCDSLFYGRPRVIRSADAYAQSSESFCFANSVQILLAGCGFQIQLQRCLEVVQVAASIGMNTGGDGPR